VFLHQPSSALPVRSSFHHIWKNHHLSITTKTHIYQALVQSVLLYANETWTLLSVDSTALEASHMKCQRQLLQSKWHQFIRNVEISATTGLPSISETICGCSNGLFGHTARLADNVPAHKALSSQINLSLGRPPNNQWSRHPGRPHNRWVDQIRRDNNLPPADL